MVVWANAAEHRRQSQLGPRIVAQVPESKRRETDGVRDELVDRATNTCHVLIVHATLIVAHFAVRFEAFEKLDALVRLVADGQRVIARRQRIDRIRIFL